MLFIHFLPLLFPCDLNYTISLPSNLLLYGTDGELRHSMLLYFMIKALIRTINSSRHEDSSEGVFGTKKHLKMVEFPLSLRHALVFKVYCSTDVTGENGRGWWWGGDSQVNVKGSNGQGEEGAKGDRGHWSICCCEAAVQSNVSKVSKLLFTQFSCQKHKW